MGNESKNIQELLLACKKRMNDEETSRKDNIMNNQEYMNNLIKKLKVNTYVLEETGEKEKYNTYKDLSILYTIVDNYARSNSLCPISCNAYSFYYLEYKNYLLMIYKKITDKDITFGAYPCFKKVEDLPYLVNFENVVTGKNMDFNNGLIMELKSVIDRLLNEGLPLYYVEQLAVDIIKNKEVEKGHVKVK